MKIAFLDIDGVVLPFDERSVPIDQAYALSILKHHGYEFVLHSSWRHSRLDEAYSLFNQIGMGLYGHCDSGIPDKGRAINNYLYETFDGEEWPVKVLVFDDMPLSIPSILVDSKECLTEELLNKIDL